MSHKFEGGDNSYRGQGAIVCEICKRVFAGPRAERHALQHLKEKHRG